MGRGRMGNSGGSSRGGSSFSGGGRGMSSGGMNRGPVAPRGPVGGGRPMGHHHTTVFIGGGHHGHYRSSGSPWVGIVVGAIFILTGLFVLMGGFASLFTSPQYLPVEAECILNEKSGGYYYTTYEYTVDGKDYRERSMQSWEFPKEEGEIVTIYYLKSDPEKIYEEVPATDNGGNGVMIFAGLICAGMGTLALVLCIKDLKKGKATSSSANGGASSSATNEETYNRCPYCGSKYSKNSNSCPKCGASKLD